MRPSKRRARIMRTRAVAPTPAPKHASFKERRKETDDGRPVISIELSDEDWTDKTPPKYVVIHWSSTIKSFTTQMTYKEPEQGKEDPSLIKRLVGKVQCLKDGINKKVTPCNFDNAHQVLCCFSVYEATKVYQTSMSPGFVRWFKVQSEVLALSQEAYKLLDYTDETIHERWEDATSLMEYHDGVKTYRVGFPNVSVSLYTWQAAGMDYLTASISRPLREATKLDKKAVVPGAFVCDETGSGKTYTVGAWLHRNGHKAVVCCPAGLVEGWVRKIKHIIPLEKGKPDRRVYAVGKAYPVKAYEYDVIVVSYAMLKKRGGWPLTQFIEDQERILVLDEGHFAKKLQLDQNDCLPLHGTVCEGDSRGNSDSAQEQAL